MGLDCDNEDTLEISCLLDKEFKIKVTSARIGLTEEASSMLNMSGVGLITGGISVI